MKGKRLDHTFDWSSIVEYRDGRLYWKIDRISGRGKGYIKTPKGSLTCKDKPGGNNKYKVRNFAYRCVTYSEHVVIWYLLKGEIPEGFEVRHIDNNPLNNHIENLVLGTHQDNMYDLVRSHSKNSLSSSNTSGFKGVHWDKRKKVFVVQVSIKGKKTSLGQYQTILDAVACRFRYERIGEVTPPSERLSVVNTSGVKGVNWDKTNERWVARITIDGKRKCVGYFKTLEEAQKAMAEYKGVL